MVFTKLLLENALAIRACNCEAASEPLLPKVARCIPVVPSRYIGKCAARVLKRSDSYFAYIRHYTPVALLLCCDNIKGWSIETTYYIAIQFQLKKASLGRLS